MVRSTGREALQPPLVVTGRIQSRQHLAEIALNVPQVGLNSIPAVEGRLWEEI